MADGNASSLTCASCGAAVALHEGVPRITGDGRVIVECGPCRRGERPVVAVEPEPVVVVPPRRRGSAAIATGAGVALIAAVAMIRESASEELPAQAIAASITVDEVETVEPSVEEPPPSRAALPEAPQPVFVVPPMPERDGVPMIELHPVLDGWVHPVPGSPDVIPMRATRKFGARRDHSARRDCGGGHCGVDLEGRRGQTLVAVGWGRIARIQPSDVGSGGKYVRIEHPGGVFTTYFHLDAIAPGLEVGGEIEVGEPVGSLGRSGIRVSMPHLHFSLEVPDARGHPRQVDPAPYLARAEVLPVDAIPDLDDAARELEELPYIADPEAPLESDEDPMVVY